MTGLSRRALLPAAIGVTGAALLGSQAQAQAQAQGLVDRPGITLEPGIHRVAANMTIKGDLLVKPGAVIEVAAGRTLTLLGGLVAPIATIFTGPGSVDLNRSRIAAAYPEWWGAAPGDSSRDSLSALAACLRAHPVMQLLAADYFISDTLVVNRSFCRISGAGFRGTDAGRGTRIVVTDGRADVLLVGPAQKPATVNDFTQNVDIRALTLARSRPADTAGGAVPAGLRAQFLLFAHIEQVAAFEHAVGFVARGLVRSTLRDCVAFRSLPGRQAQQPYRGFLLDGSTDIGLAGGNASLFLTDCNATIGGDPQVADAVGLLLDGAFADSFITAFEATGLATGIRVEGRAATLGARGRSGHINLHIRMPILDQCSRVGIEVNDTSAYAMIDITEPYVATTLPADAALRFAGLRGAATVTGGQLVRDASVATGNRALGLAVTASRGLQVAGLKILNHMHPVAVDRSSGFALGLAVANPGSRPGGAAAVLRDCEGGSMQLLLSGQDRSFTAGILLEGTVSRLRLDAAGIAPQAVGGATNRIWANGRGMAIPFRDAQLTIEGP